MQRTAAMPGAYFRVGVATAPQPPRYYRERRCLPCSWVTAWRRVLDCEIRGALCRTRRRLMRAYLRALVSEAVPAWALPALRRVVWWQPPAPRRRVALVLLIEVLVLVLVPA